MSSGEIGDHYVYLNIDTNVCPVPMKTHAFPSQDDARAFAMAVYTRLGDVYGCAVTGPDGRICWSIGDIDFDLCTASDALDVIDYSVGG